MSELLKPLTVLTTKLQAESLTIPQFHAYQLLAMNQVKSVVENHDNWKGGRDLIELINARKAKIYENPIILAGVFLDPRFRKMMTAEQKVKAKAASDEEMTGADYDVNEDSMELGSLIGGSSGASFDRSQESSE